MGGGRGRGSGKLAEVGNIRWSVVEKAPGKMENEALVAALRLSPAVLCDRGTRKLTY